MKPSNDMVTVPISATQYSRVLKAEQTRVAAEQERDLILSVILEGTKYAGKDMIVVNVNKDGIHLKYSNPAPLPFKKITKEG